MPFQHHVHAAVQRLLGDYGADALDVCEASWADFAMTERPKQQKVISKAVLDKMYCNWRVSAPPRSLQIALSAPTDDGRAGAGDCLSAVPFSDALTLPDDAYQFAVRLRLGLPLAVTDSACSVFNNSTRRPCGCQLTAMVDKFELFTQETNVRLSKAHLPIRVRNFSNAFSIDYLSKSEFSICRYEFAPFSVSPLIQNISEYIFPIPVSSERLL